MNSSNSPADQGADGPPAKDVDRALLAALARDGRASYTDLAERVGLSVSAVHQRVRRLEPVSYTHLTLPTTERV